MALELRQQLKLTQQLVMTPQLQQAIKLLQLSRMELVELVQQELEENPVLEETTEIEPLEVSGVDAENLIENRSLESAGDNQVEEVRGEEEGLGDIDWQSYLEGYSLGGTVASAYEEDDERPSFENLLTRTTTLVDHLMWQMTLSHFDAGQRLIATELIGNIDEDGYLKATVEEVASATSATPEAVAAVLTMVQEFDPPGVAGRSLQECLLIQIRLLGMQGSLVENILTDHIADLETRRYPAIAKALGVSLDEVIVAAKLIANLDPRPGSPYGEEDVHYITPDIFVHKVGSEYVVVLNDEGLPT